MKKTSLIFISFIFLILLVLSFKNTSWSFKPENAIIRFYLPADSAGSSGEFKLSSGVFNFDTDLLNKSNFSGEINVQSLQSNDSVKVQHLLSEEFLNSEKHPTIRFTSEKIQKSGDHFIATGKLFLKGIEKKENVNFYISSMNGFSFFNGILEFYTGDYGVMKKSNSGADKIKVIIQVPLTKE